MCAYRGPLVERPALVAVRGDLVLAAPDQTPLAAGDVFGRSDLARRHVVEVLRGDVDVLLEELLERRRVLELDARRVVQLRPRVVAPDDEVGEENAGDRPVGHPLPGA